MVLGGGAAHGHLGAEGPGPAPSRAPVRHGADVRADGRVGERNRSPRAAKRRHHQHTLRSARLDPEQQAIERELSRTEKQQCDCSDEEQELELPTPFAREPLVHLQDFEANRAQHDEDEPGRRCLREQANQRRQTAQRLGDGEDPQQRQQARRQLSRRLHLPHGALLVAVDEKDGPDTQSERQQTPVAELMQARQDAHEVPPVARQNLARLHLWHSRYSLFRVLTRDGWLLFLTRCTRLFAYGALSVVLVFYLTSLGLSTSQTDRKSTRLNSSHPSISYAVFCLKKKKKKTPD